MSVVTRLIHLVTIMMPSLFPINPSVIPTVTTRKALLVLDFQNDFLSPDGPLYTEEPEGFVDRTLDLAKAFRDSGAGDVVWVRSEFDSHRPLSVDGDQIITADTMLRQHKATPARGRQPAPHDSAAMEADEEAFLSLDPEGEKKPCVRKGTPGAEFAPTVQAAVVAGRDIVFTKTHYSAFSYAQQQLVQMLRARFVTQMYVCGAMTNISVYATALDAGRHGYEMTIVDDCCGYRSPTRHFNAVRQLEQLTGSEVISSDSLLAQLRAPTTPGPSTGLSPSISKMTLDLGGASPARSAAAPPGPPTPKPVAAPVPDRGNRKEVAPPRRLSSNQTGPEADSADNSQPLQADSNISSDISSDTSSDSESLRRRERETKREEAHGSVQAAAAKHSELESQKGPTRAPRTTSTQAEKLRIKSRVKQRITRSSSDKSPPSPAPSPPESAESTASPIQKPRDTTGQPAAITQAPTPVPTSSEPKSAPRSPSNMAKEHLTPTCSEPLCEGDTTVITNFLPSALAADAFERLLDEVSWAGMSHMGGEVPRRIAVQGAVAEDGSMPVYRHPADESPPLLPFSPTVLQIQAEVEKHVGHPVNHVLIQHYRSGNDYISEHSDKTLDIVPGSFVANVSLGAERTMVFRTKRPPKDGGPHPDAVADEANPPPPSRPARQIQRAPLPHNSLCRMGLATNQHWLHAIRQDRRADRDKAPAELAYGSARISLTFRRIGTFIDASQTLIWGQGATAKTRAGAGAVVNGQTDEAVRLLKAFGAENNLGAGFKWAEWYGGGFDVLHMGVPKRFFTAAAPDSADGAPAPGGPEAIVNARVALALAELGVGCAKGSVSAEGGEARFEDNDPARAAVDGHASVLRYLDAVYGAGRRYDQMLPGEVARRFTRLQRALDLLGKWRAALAEAGVVSLAAGEDGGGRASAEQTGTVARLLKKELEDWEAFAREAAAAAAAAAPPTTSASTSTSASTTVAQAEAEAEAEAQQAQTQSQTANGSFYIAGGDQPSPADFALWPVLHDMVRVCGEGVLGEQRQHLRRYYAAFGQRSSAAKALAMFGARSGRDDE